MSARRRVATGLALLTTSALLAACSSGGGDPAPTGAPESSAPAEASAFPVTIEHALGTATIDDAPERVVTIGWASQDTALALGVVPVGIPFDGFAGDPETGLLPWTQEAIDELGAEAPQTFVDLPEVNPEEVAGMNPDLVLATYSGLTQDVYDQISTFADVVAYPEQPWLVSWRDQTLINGRALGLEAEAEALVADMEAQIAQAAAANPSLEGTTFAYVYASPEGTLQAYVEGDPRVDLLTGLGMELAPGVAELEAPAGSFFVDLGTEGHELLADADVLLTWFNDEAEQERVEGTGTFAAIPAVERGTYLPLLDRQLNLAMTTTTALSLPWGLEKFVPQLVEATEAGGA